MIVYVNERNEIKDVNHTNDTTLRPIDLTGKSNPFENKSIAEICCYKVRINERGNVVTQPYVDTKLIEHIANLGKANETNANSITDMQLAICDIYEATL